MIKKSAAPIRGTEKIYSIVGLTSSLRYHSVPAAKINKATESHDWFFIFFSEDAIYNAPKTSNTAITTNDCI